jgi:primosomal protein N' (replication factor Y) (superfamily II helicase)
MHKRYAEVYLDIKALNVSYPFDYKIPSYMASDIQTGVVVQVPFKNRVESGYVVKVKDRSELEDKDIKDVIKISSKKPVFDSVRLELIRWISQYYIQPFGSVAKYFTPPGEKSNKSVQGGGIHLKFRDYVFLNRNIYEKIKDKINWDKNYSKKRIVDYLIFQNGVLKEKLIKDTGSSYSILAELADKSIISIIKKRQRRDFKYDYHPYINNKKNIILNTYQKEALSIIGGFLKKGGFHKFLIEGVPGSGKTDIYIGVCRQVLKNNKKALVLTPEISLIPQLYYRFESEFGRGVGVYHSNMSEAERYERWLDIWEDRFDIIIGTRSSIFTPLNDLGVIIIDEEHDTSYKEGTGIRYNAGDVSIKMGELLNIPVILGSATPSIVTRFRAEKEKDFTLIKIPIKAQSVSPIQMNIVDLRKIDRNKEDEVITGELFRAIRSELDKGNKVIVFINRRGYSNFVICNKCGNVPKCPACNLPYNYHSDIKKLVCHHCGRIVDYTGKCDVCGAENILLRGAGIQRVQAKIQERFKGTPVIRMDSDATVKKKSHQELLKKFIAPGGSILIGTQMIAKGLDIEDITLVGIINCDSMLVLPDYHINERVYQLVTQVAGRAGRRKEGKVIIQTYNPESRLMKSILQDDYELFYRQELEDRKELAYPPFSSLINVIVSGKDELQVKKDIKNLSAQLNKVIGNESIMLGPSPAPFQKINMFYRWHIIIKVRDVFSLSGKIAGVLKGFKKFNENRIILDVDPVWIL